MTQVVHISLASLDNLHDMCVSILVHPYCTGYVLGKDFPKYEAQSGMVHDVKSDVAASDKTNTALKFAEGLPGMMTSVPAHKDDTYNMLHNDEIGLHDFLSRPIRIAQYDWDAYTTINIQTVSVVKQLLENKRISNRVNNFSFLSATVHVRVIVTGVPQHYGHAIASLNPWYDVDTNFDLAGGMGGPTLNQLVQLPHIFIDPSTSTAGEISIPLITPFNALALDDEESIKSVVGLHWMSFTGLGNVQGGNAGAHIAFWAWMSDVKISNPTSGDLPYLEAQSGDEYGKAPVSKAASTVANYAGLMTEIPVIGPYARATEMVASHTARIAELFGFSRPNALKTEIPHQHKNIGNLVNGNFEDTSTKLTLDSKAEVTIDPCVSGVSLTDEMSITSICSREGYLGAFSWTSEQANGQPIARMRVTPALTREINSTGIEPTVGPLVDLTPMGFVSNAFRKWRGSLRFRFVVAASHFHKGRIRIVFEPRNALGILAGNTQWAAESNINQSYILDLSSTKELIVTVPWASNKSYLTCSTTGLRDMHDFGNPQSLALFDDVDYFNGSLGVHVLTPITAPTTAASVRILVFVSAGEDIEFAEPANSFANMIWTGWEPQSGAEPGPSLGSDVLTGNQLTLTPEDNHGQDILGTRIKAENEKLALIHYGERIVSIRQLLKRYVHHSHCLLQALPGVNQWRWVNCDFPYYKGWDANSLTRDTDNNAYNYARDSFMAYFALAYLGRRGSIRQKYIISSSESEGIAYRDAYVCRAPNLSEGQVINQAFRMDSASTVADNINNGFDTRAGATGVYLPFNNCIEAETPYYSPLRFKFAKQLQHNINPPSSDGRFHENFHMCYVKVGVAGGSFLLSHVTRFVAAGDDFSLVFFKYAPVGRLRGNPVPSS